MWWYRKLEGNIMIIDFIKDKVYLDGGATQPMSNKVISKLNTLNMNNVIAPNLDYDECAYNEVMDSIETIAGFLGKNGDDITFGKSTTELLNNVAKQIDNMLIPGQEIVISDEEHNANYYSWVEACHQSRDGHTLVVLPFEDIADYILTKGNKVGIVSVAKTTNVIGITRDLDDIIMSKSGCTFLIVDGCQHAPHVNKVDIPEGVDMYVFSPHKLHGPKGLGVAFINSDMNTLLRPFLQGGGNNTFLDNYGVITDLYDSYRHLGGTQNWNNVIATAKAIKQREGLDFSREFLKRQVLVQLLSNLDVTVYNSDECYDLSTTVLFSFNNIHDVDAMFGGIDVDYCYAKENIYVRYGEMCNVLTMKKLGIDGCIRVSVSHYNTYDNLLKFYEVTENIIKLHGGNNELRD